MSRCDQVAVNDDDAPALVPVGLRCEGCGLYCDHGGQRASATAATRWLCCNCDPETWEDRHRQAAKYTDAHGTPAQWTAPAEEPPQAFLWLDLETTGLDPSVSCIIEAAWFVTPLSPALGEAGSINPSECSSALIRPEVGTQWDAAATDMHEASGLVRAAFDPVLALHDVNEVQTLMLRPKKPAIVRRRVRVGARVAGERDAR